MENFDKIILILYGAITIFFMYRIFKKSKDKKMLGANAKAFKRPITSMEVILFSILVVVGGINIVNGYKVGDKYSIMTAAVMIILAIVFMVFSLSKLYIAENGMLLNMGFVSFKELKKWGFDTNRGDLVMAVKKDGNTNRESIKVKKEDIEEINGLIRKYKLGK
ncbi:DUF5673 domain-containing protein [uncultured Anaerococcus sp.]|uniref:DUF5673 domain-containing protein n=1 Tax=uncultured Anaerococcus sp. TaxID=293428 RepID=UPI0025F7709C|nr:DUF5673 domain-containing protein [uncultured Anaerococcus sp.]